MIATDAVFCLEKVQRGGRHGSGGRSLLTYVVRERFGWGTRRFLRGSLSG
jgi:hypothetical protein